ncbi:MAG: 4-alpha-glucanotransferase, partial [Planctomycetes bacterium]|nr:4-alpha-glucanotransferase [Planctomycetota bacterium]
VLPSTHDTDTAVGWFAELTRRECGTGLQPVAFTGRNGRHSVGERKRVLAYLHCVPAEVHWALIRSAYGSPADLAIVPVQDVLGLDSRARMNRPASARGNWRWRLQPKALTPDIAHRLRELVEMYQRGPGSSVPIPS